MTEVIIAALIAGVCGVLGQMIISKSNSDKLYNKLDKQSELTDQRIDAKLDRYQEVTNTKLQALTDEVRKHNGFAERIPVLEEKIKVANNRIADLEHKN